MSKIHRFPLDLEALPNPSNMLTLVLTAVNSMAGKDELHFLRFPSGKNSESLVRDEELVRGIPVGKQAGSKHRFLKSPDTFGTPWEVILERYSEKLCMTY
jgi:hypothetical protein